MSYQRKKHCPTSSVEWASKMPAGREFGGPYAPLLMVVDRAHGPCASKTLSQLAAERVAKAQRENNRVYSGALAVKDVEFDTHVHDFINRTNHKYINGVLRRKISTALELEECALEKRRDRLRQLLSDDDETFRQMATAVMETTEQRQQAMRARVAELKERKEETRRAFVQKKQMEIFSQQSDELRQRRSEALTRLNAADRQVQIAAKQEIMRQAEEEEAMFSQLLWADMMLKARREELDTAERMRKDNDVACMLREHEAERERKLAEKKAQAERELRERLEQARMFKEEEQLIRESNHKKKMEMRNFYDGMLEEKAERTRRCNQAEKDAHYSLSIDLGRAKDGCWHEVGEKNPACDVNKQAEHDEQLRYMAYVKQEREKLKIEEEKLMNVVNAEVERVQRETDARREREKAARNRLHCDVIMARKEQVREKEEEKEALALHAKMMEERRLRDMDEIAATDDFARSKEKKKDYGRYLTGQIQYRQQKRLADKDEDARMYQKGVEAEEEYRRKVDELMKGDPIDRLHPMLKRVPPPPCVPDVPQRVVLCQPCITINKPC